ncbi:MAG TPA: tRNA pseudouridine(38-40) synthase TruA [Vicinamibacterales bacterium]|jgi:tRNA pseudouridine38-40 synthase
MTRTLKLVLAYDGTSLVGWQRQAEGLSVQFLLEAGLAAIEGAPVTVVGAGRTDAGVHALGQVASCRLEHPIPAETLRRALNARLPGEVRVLDVESMPETFHARYSALRKTYRYLVLNAGIVPPFVGRYVWHVPSVLDVSRMAEAARLLEGAHDFAALQGAGSAVKNTTRELAGVSVSQTNVGRVFGEALAGGESMGAARVVVFEMTGNGFLRHMVRNAVGSLVEIGHGHREPAWLGEVLRSRDRTLAGPTAPAAGLFLVRVDY